MEIIEHPSREWHTEVECHRCSAKLHVNQDDVQLEGFKTSGYHFAGTAVIEDFFIVVCPVDKADIRVSEKYLPVVLKDELREALRKKRQERGY